MDIVETLNSMIIGESEIKLMNNNFQKYHARSFNNFIRNAIESYNSMNNCKEL